MQSYTLISFEFMNFYKLKSGLSLHYLINTELALLDKYSTITGHFSILSNHIRFKISNQIYDLVPDCRN